MSLDCTSPLRTRNVLNGNVCHPDEKPAKKLRVFKFRYRNNLLGHLLNLNLSKQSSPAGNHLPKTNLKWKTTHFFISVMPVRTSSTLIREIIDWCNYKNRRLWRVVDFPQISRRRIGLGLVTMQRKQLTAFN